MVLFQMKNFLIEFINDAKHREDQPVLLHFSTWYYTIWLLENQIDKKDMKILEPDYRLSVVPTDKSYCIHLYDFGWRDNTKKPWEVI